MIDSADIKPMHKRVIGLDVHPAKITAVALTELPDGKLQTDRREFGAFKKDRLALGQWARSHDPEVVVMESTGIYWKSPYAALEDVGIVSWVVNARHVKAVPGRKTDMCDAHWLACLARAGLLRASFVPIKEFRSLRIVARERQKMVGQLSAEKNREHKVLADAGVRLNVVVCDIHGNTATRMIEDLLDGKPLEEIVEDRGRLRATAEQLADALDTDRLSEAHRFTIKMILKHIRELEDHIAELDQFLLEKLQPWTPQLNLLVSMPGIDRIGAAMLLIEIGADMTAFGSAEKLASWVGMCPGNNESAGKRMSGKIRRGNAWVRRLLCEFAQAAARTECAFKKKFESLKIRKGYKKSIIAVAHKMLRTIYAMLSTGALYKDTTVDYKALMVKRNTPRWLKWIAEYGGLPKDIADDLAQIAAMKKAEGQSKTGPKKTVTKLKTDPKPKTETKPKKRSKAMGSATTAATA